MKKVVSVTMGSSKKDFSFETDFLGQYFQVQRMGADRDSKQAWELMRRQQAHADAIGLGTIVDDDSQSLQSLNEARTIASVQGGSWLVPDSASWWVFPLVITGVFVLVQKIDTFLITPRIVGDRVGG